MAYLSIADERRKKLAEKFFGNDFQQINRKQVIYKSVIDINNIIFLTTNVRIVFTGDNTLTYVFATLKNRGVYLRKWQVAKVKVNGSAKETAYLVKLNRDHFHSYAFKGRDILNHDDSGGFTGITNTEEITFTDLYNASVIQGQKKTKIELCLSEDL